MSGDSFVAGQTVRRVGSSVESVSRPLDPTSLAFDCRNSLFTHPTYLSALGVRHVVEVRRCGRVRGMEHSPNAFFSDLGGYFLHLGRLDRIGESEMHDLAAALLDEFGAKIVVFEDVEIVPDGTAKTLPCLKFSYQNNWRIDLANGVPAISASQRRNMRTKARKLAKLTGGEIRFAFDRPTVENIDRIVGFNREKVQLSGRRHRMGDDRLATLKTVCADIGYTALLYSDDQLIAGDVVCVTPNGGYTLVGGFDVRLAKAAPGIQMHRFTIDQLCSLGCPAANLMWGDSPVKAQLGAERRPLTTVVIARNHLALPSAGFAKACSTYGIAAFKGLVKRHILRRQPLLTGTIAWELAPSVF